MLWSHFKKKKIYHGCHNFLSKPSFESHLQDEKGSEASEYLDVFQPKESSHVPPIITSVQPIGEPCMLTTENAGPDPSLLPSHDHTRIETNAPLQCHESEPGHDWNLTDLPSNEQSKPVQSVLPSPSSQSEFINNLSIPIAIQKGVRYCTKPPMSNYVSYKNLLPSFFCIHFTTF